MAKFDPFLSLDCARVEGVRVLSEERSGSHFAAQRSGAIVQKPKGPNTRSKNLAIAIWQPCLSALGSSSPSRSLWESWRLCRDPRLTKASAATVCSRLPSRYSTWIDGVMVGVT